MKENILIALTLIVALILGTLAVISVGSENTKKNKAWCQENGGAWLVVPHNSYCAFPPK